jgi:hypothetical protein
LDFHGKHLILPKPTFENILYYLNKTVPKRLQGERERERERERGDPSSASLCWWLVSASVGLGASPAGGISL